MTLNNRHVGFKCLVVITYYFIQEPSATNEEETTCQQQHQNGYYTIEGLRTLELTGRTYSVSLENILKELSTCDVHGLAQKMLSLQNLEAMKRLHVEMVENYERKERTTYYTKELEHLKKESRSRMERIRQTICFTNYLLEQQKKVCSVIH